MRNHVSEEVRFGISWGFYPWRWGRRSRLAGLVEPGQLVAEPGATATCPLAPPGPALSCSLDEARCPKGRGWVLLIYLTSAPSVVLGI